GLERSLVAFTGADPHGGLDRVHEDLAVTDVAGLRGRGDDLDDLVDDAIGDDHLDHHLRQEVDRVLAAAIQLGVALLSTEPSDPGDRHTDHADSGERLLDVIQLERLDDRFDLLHAFPPGRSTKATPMPHLSKFASGISRTCARLPRGPDRPLPTK